MKAPLLLALAVLSALPAFGQYSARTLTRRIAPQTQRPPAQHPATTAPTAPVQNAPQQRAPAVPYVPAPSAPADPAKVAAEKQKTESDLIKYYKQRAEAGSENAQYELGMRYLTGNGVGQDEKLGREWIAKSAKAGNPKAVRKIEELGGAPEEAKEAKPADAAK